MKPVLLIAALFILAATDHSHPADPKNIAHPAGPNAMAQNAMPQNTMPQNTMPQNAGARYTIPGPDTLTSGVHPYPGDDGQVLTGATHDLSLLEISTFSLAPHQWFASYSLPDSSDELLIVKKGSLTVSSDDSITGLGPGGVALFNAGALYYLQGGSTDTTVFYLFRFQSRRRRSTTLAGDYKAPFVLDWPAMTVRHTAKGESRQIFSRPVTWLSKIDMHATTLNPGEVSHPPHIHRAEEIILLRSGHVQMYINGRHYPAAGGDLVFLASGNPHALENKSAERCEYFALQWQQ